MSEFKDYSDMLELKRPVSKRHAPMTRSNRAAQFAPFAALTGYGEAINETGRRVDKKIALSEDEIDEINEKLNFLTAHKDENIKVNIVYFVADEKKAGGAYFCMAGIVRNVYPERDEVQFSDKTSIKISDIRKITAPEIEFLE
ncbi:MAG: hypothetical protein J6U25_01835 [Clostridia bacterium]|nr:hypothetical protein [Clostridia bacterium]